MTIFPQRMKRLTAVILQDDADTLTRRLLNAGVMDFIDIRTADNDMKESVSPWKQRTNKEDLQDVRRRIEMFLGNAHLPLPASESLDADSYETIDIDAVNKELDKLAAGIQQIRDNQQSAQQEIHRLQELRRQISLFQEITELVPSDSYVEVQAGTIGKSRWNSLISGLKGFPVYIHQGESEESSEYPVLLIYMKRDAERIGQVLDRVQWKSIDIPDEFRGLKETVLEELDDRIRAEEKRQKELARSAEELVEGKQERLEQNWKNIRISELYTAMQTNYGKTGETAVLSGWIPAHRAEQVTKTIEEVTNGRCYLEWKEPERDSSIKKEHVPVQLEHSKVLSPFQWLVENYSVPQYGSIDPTVLVFATYLIMFGLMFGDAGHGAVLMLVGWLIRVILKRRHSDKPQQSQVQHTQTQSTAAKLGELIFWCGSAAVVMGVLFGSYFGWSWFPPLWFDYHSIVSGHGGGSVSYVSSIYDILGITIKFGIGIIGAGIVLNCVNRARSRDWFHLVFDGGGLLAGWFYAGGVYAGFHFVNSGYLELPAAGTLFWTIGLPLLLFIAKAPLERMQHLESGEHIKPSQLFNFLMEWIVELLELFTSYLSNTLSFMRIAGLGIAHVSLLTAFFQIADTASSPVGSAAILIAGNAVVIVLEGLSAGIQALRLHYYEFFSKYFCGSGRVYKPISLRRSS